MISGSKVFDGISKYVVAVGTKSFNGCIILGMYSSFLGGTSGDHLCLLYSTSQRHRRHSPSSEAQQPCGADCKIGSLAGLILYSALMIKFVSYSLALVTPLSMFISF